MRTIYWLHLLAILTEGDAVPAWARTDYHDASLMKMTQSIVTPNHRMPKVFIRYKMQTATHMLQTRSLGVDGLAIVLRNVEFPTGAISPKYGIIQINTCEVAN